jgi:CRISPR-associated exonuclease Cas4
MFSEQDLVAISGLQHLAFCPRQWGLIHLDQEWEENRLTAEGRTLHERVDSGYREFRKGKRQFSGLHVQSRELGLYGRLDILEVLENADAPEVDIPLLGLKGKLELSPVEFKHGKPKKHDADRVQLCAQALCLEEMTGLPVQQGSFFYGEIKCRETCEFSEDLRVKTRETALLAHRLMEIGQVPGAIPGAQCRACSLADICMPKSRQNLRLDAYKKELFG